MGLIDDLGSDDPLACVWRSTSGRLKPAAWGSPSSVEKDLCYLEELLSKLSYGHPPLCMDLLADPENDNPRSTDSSFVLSTFSSLTRRTPHLNVLFITHHIQYLTRREHSFNYFTYLASTQLSFR
jgi:hypothetical protein